LSWFSRKRKKIEKLTMRKLLLFFGLLAAIQLQNKAMAQINPPDIENINFNADLQGAFNLEVQDGRDQLATFRSAEDYNLGISENSTPGIEPGYTTVYMEATGNWNLKIHSSDFMPTTGTGSIPIDNLGVYCEASGEHQFGTEVTCDYQSAQNALGLSTNDVTLIDLLTDNSGDQNDNLFVLHWLMGTMQGNMRQESMFSQLSDGTFSQGQYTTTVVLTMTEIP
jgi:hypothetical protein